MEHPNASYLYIDHKHFCDCFTIDVKTFGFRHSGMSDHICAKISIKTGTLRKKTQKPGVVWERNHEAEIYSLKS